MKTTLKIAKTELNLLFYSPIPWLLMIIFILQGGLDFMHQLERFVNLQAEHMELKGLTATIFNNLRGGGEIFPNMQKSIYLYVPLLTMGLMSRELSSGSIKLLLSSPVRIREIVLGKFLAIMVYWSILMALLGLYVIAGHFMVVGLEWKYLLSGILGLYLLVGVYSAIGLFLSCLTNYAVIAAIGTLALLAALDYAGGLWQGIPVVGEIAHFLSPGRHAGPFLDGLIVTKNLFYYVIMIALFLGLAIFYLQDTLNSLSRWIKTGRYLMFTGGLLLLGYLGSRPSLTLYYDTTTTQRNTLTGTTQAIIQKLKKPVKVTAYANLLGDDVLLGLPENRINDLEYWGSYLRFMPDMQLVYVNYCDSVYDDPGLYCDTTLNLSRLALKMANSMDLDFDQYQSPNEIHKLIDPKTENGQFFRKVTDAEGKRDGSIRMFRDITRVPGEAEIAAAFKRVTDGPAKVGFLTGNHERSIDREGDKDYKLLANTLWYRPSMVNHGFDVLSVDPAQDLPPGLTALVILDPATPFTPEALGRIQQYIAGGGNLLIAGEEGRQGLLNPVIGPLGLHFMEGTLIEQSHDYPPDHLFVHYSKDAKNCSARYGKFQETEQRIFIPGAAALKIDNTVTYHMDTVLATDGANTWNKMGGFVMDTGHVSYNPERGDIHSSLPVAMALRRKVGSKEQHIMILGDADFIDNENIVRDQIGDIWIKNKAFGTEILRWLTNGVYPPDLGRPDGKDNLMILTQKGVLPVRVFFLGILPGVMLIAGFVLLLRRRRK